MLTGQTVNEDIGADGGGPQQGFTEDQVLDAGWVIDGEESGYYKAHRWVTNGGIGTLHRETAKFMKPPLAEKDEVQYPNKYGGLEEYRAYQAYPGEIPGESKWDRIFRRIAANHREEMLAFGGGSYNMSGGYGRIAQVTRVTRGGESIIKGFTQHGASQAVARGFKTADILKIVREGEVVQAMGRYGPQVRYTVGGNTVVLNALGKVVTVFSNAAGTAKGLDRGFFMPF